MGDNKEATWRKKHRNNICWPGLHDKQDIHQTVMCTHNTQQCAAELVYHSHLCNDKSDVPSSMDYTHASLDLLFSYDGIMQTFASHVVVEYLRKEDVNDKAIFT